MGQDACVRDITPWRGAYGSGYSVPATAELLASAMGREKGETPGEAYG